MVAAERRSVDERVKKIIELKNKVSIVRCTYYKCGLFGVAGLY